MSEISKLNGYDIKDKKAIRYYDNVASMIIDTTLKEGMHVKTKGYYESNDGGNAEYIIKSNSTKYHEELTNELMAELIAYDNINIKQLGAYGDNTHDDTNIIQYAINNYKNVYIPKGTYLISDSINIKENKHIYGDNSFITTLKYSGNSACFIVKYDYFGKTSIKNLNLSHGSSYVSTDNTSIGIKFEYNNTNNRTVTNFLLENVSIYYFYYSISNNTSNALLDSLFEKCIFAYAHIHVKNIGGYNNYFNNCSFSHSEDYAYEQQAGEMTFTECKFENNTKGINLKASKGFYNFVNCFFEGATTQPSFINVTNTGLDPISLINIENCHFYGSVNQVYLTSVKKVNIKGCSMSNSSTRCIYYSTSNDIIENITLINNVYNNQPAKAKFVHDPSYDTGWVEIDTTNATRGNFVDFKVRRIGKMVYWSGKLNMLTGNDKGQTFGITLPEEFRPEITHNTINPTSNTSDNGYWTNYSDITIYNQGYFQYNGSNSYNSTNVIDLNNISYLAI